MSPAATRRKSKGWEQGDMKDLGAAFLPSVNLSALVVLQSRATQF